MAERCAWNERHGQHDDLRNAEALDYGVKADQSEANRIFAQLSNALYLDSQSEAVNGRSQPYFIGASYELREGLGRDAQRHRSSNPSAQ